MEREVAAVQRRCRYDRGSAALQRRVEIPPEVRASAHRINGV
jgi:hypothetical protein